MTHAVLILGLALNFTAPPAAGKPAPTVLPLARPAAVQYATEIIDAAALVVREHPRTIPARDLLVPAVARLYAAAGQPLPSDLPERFARTRSAAAYQEILTDIRLALGDHPALAGHRAYILSADSLARAADPHSGLTARTPTSPGGSETEFGMGFELDGASGIDWLAFEVDLREARTARRPPFPLPIPWRVTRVLPGSPAAAAGLRPGDAIMAVDRKPITAATANEQIAGLLAVRTRQEVPPQPGGEVVWPKVRLTVTRPGRSAPLDLAVTAQHYEPESVFGYRRRPDETWDYFPDPPSKIAYLRLGYMENNAADDFLKALDQIAAERPDGLVLDVRWCGGGFVKPVQVIAAQFLKPDQPVTKLRYKDPGRNEGGFLPPGQDFWQRIPLAVLVNGETAGGGEMIAAAVQDYGRAIVVGQRTVGRANISTVSATRVPGVSLRLTIGYSDRPNGKNRHRLPSHGPLDDWGVRPDPGCEVPTTGGHSRQLREWAELQALRRPGGRDALPSDDPLADPQRLLAVRLLAEKIGKEK